MPGAEESRKLSLALRSLQPGKRGQWGVRHERGKYANPRFSEVPWRLTGNVFNSAEHFRYKAPGRGGMTKSIQGSEGQVRVQMGSEKASEGK